MQTSPGRGNGKSSNVRFGSERFESIKSQPTTQRLDAIDVFCAGASNDERSLRRRLHRAQAAGASAATYSPNSRARAVFWMASQWAAEATFSPAPIEDLKEVINGISYLYLAARLAERIEGADVG